MFWGENMNKLQELWDYLFPSYELVCFAKYKNLEIYVKQNKRNRNSLMSTEFLTTEAGRLVTKNNYDVKFCLKIISLVFSGEIEGTVYNSYVC